MPVEVLIDLMVKIIFMAGLGFVLHKAGLMPDNFQKALSEILVCAVMPLNILAVGNSAFEARMAQNMLWAVGIIGGYYAAIIPLSLLFGRLMRAERRNTQVFTGLITFANVGYIGFPVAQGLFGGEGLMYAMVGQMIFQIVIYSIGVRLITGLGLTFRQFITQPVTITILLSVAIFISPVRLPAPLLGAVQQVGDMTAPISMFIIGASLSKIRFATLWTSGRVWVVSLLRQVVIPLALAGVLWLCGMRGILPATCVVTLGLPTATMMVILAKKYNTEEALATRAISQGAILMAGTLPLLAVVCGRLFL